MDLGLLKALSDEFGPSGFEDRVRKIISANINGSIIDAMGNLIGQVGESGPRVLISAHMDEVGFMVTHVDQRGFLRIAPLGGLDAWTMLGQEVMLRNKEGELVRGVVGVDPPHLRRDRPPSKFEELYVDAGFSSREDAARAGVMPGTPGTFSASLVALGNAVMGKALDDRVGAYALIEAMRRTRDSNASLFFAWNTQEEVGLRGIQAVVNRVNPDLAIVVETTTAADVPGNPEEQWITALCGGAAVRAMDRSMITNPVLLSKSLEALEARRVKYQVQVNPYGGTDAGAVHIHGTGVPTLVISTPARYIHSPRSVACIDDIEQVVNALMAVLSSVDTLMDSIARRD
ncbi:peptidase M42 [Thermocladium modestius]|uniref:Peptidase M42 n=1 Tax=Thermocladium modestius TaxID=62609 RepID=A0A830GTN1_9CREN|nr:M42 family metallopeptidase [Thermocladium modestius]GGP19601.1 peptidase M42 [Thermocladium modestius]